MSAIDNGGSAFPVPELHIGHDTKASCDNQGMTLRDYFAAAALTGLISTGLISTGNYRLRTIECSEVAYDYADAMLAAREEGA